MIVHYIKFAIINLKKHKTYSIINILGLTVGLATSILIFLFVFNELTYDRYHNNAEDIYRLTFEIHYKDGTTYSYLDNYLDESIFLDTEKNLKGNLPEILQAVQVHKRFPSIEYEDRKFYESEGTYFISEGFFDIFSIKFVKGDPNTFYQNPSSIIITEKTAQKYFGDEDPINKALLLDGKYQFNVTGIIQSVPENSHLKPNILIPFSALSTISNQMIWEPFTTYVKIAKGTNIQKTENKIDTFENERQKSTKYFLKFILEPITDIHLYSKFKDNTTGGDIRYVIIYSAIAVLVLLLACINFMNLSTARYATRAKEIGLRKVIGADRMKLIRQLMGESMIISLISLINAIVLAEILLPIFNDLIGKELTITYSLKSIFIPCILLLGIIVGLISGSYPSFYLSSLNPITALKSKIIGSKKAKFFRQTLVVFQLFISMILISSSLIIYHQLNFIHNEDIGINKENVIVVKHSNREINKNINPFKNDLAKLPGVISASVCSDYPGDVFQWDAPFTVVDQEEQKEITVPIIDIDYDYFQTIGAKFFLGRNFSPEYSTDTGSIVINKTLMKDLRWNDPINKKLHENKFCEKGNYKVIGVINDYHHSSIHSSIMPMIFRLNKRFNSYTMIRIEPKNQIETISEIEKVWNRYSPFRPLDYFFLSNSYDSQYKTEERLGDTILFFTLIGIVIACLGLIGLASFIIGQRTKEVGIRKVYGSDTQSVFMLLGKEFILIIFIALIISIPVTWYFMNSWLEKFAYAIKISALIFVTTAIIVLLLTAICVTYQSLRAAFRNPLDVLRYE